MAVAHSASSESHTGTTGSANQAVFTWTHTQTGTPNGVLVFVHVTNSATDTVTSVSYGSTTLTRVSGGSAVDTAGEPGRTDLFFAGSGLPTGNQTVTVNRTNNANIMYATVATVTAATDTNVTGFVLLQGDGTLAEQSVTDGSPGSNSVRYAGIVSGLNAPPAAGASSTLLQSIDVGNQTAALVRETTAGQGARNVGFTSGTTDDRAAVHVAVRELFNRSMTGGTGTFTLTGNAANLAKGRKLTTDVGSFTLTGNNATLQRGVAIAAETGVFNFVGNPANLLQGFNLVANTGSFTLTGNPATLVKGTALKILTADVGTFNLVGNPATLSHSVALAGARGEFLLTGNPVVLNSGKTALLTVGTFALTGNPVNFVREDKLIGVRGEFILTGLSATLAKTSTARRRNVFIF